LNETSFKENLTVGQELPSYSVKVESKIYRRYNRLIREINPIHLNKSYAQKLGFENIVVAGNFLFTFIPKWILDWIPIPSALKKATVYFENPVYPDEEIIHKGTIQEIEELSGQIKVICEYHVEKGDGTPTSKGKIILNFKK